VYVAGERYQCGLEATQIVFQCAGTVVFAIGQSHEELMQIPLQVTFEGTDPSDVVRATIVREVERLERHNHHIIGCRVSVIGPSHKHRHGSGFHVHFALTLPPHENVIVNHEPSDESRHEHAEVAVKDAFASARRQLDALA
jgi:hypothetical protein